MAKMPMAFDDEVKVYFGSYTTNSAITVGTTNNVTVTDLPTGTIKGVIPYGVNPDANWDNYPVISGTANSGKTITFKIVGTGTAQKHSFKYAVIYV